MQKNKLKKEKGHSKLTILAATFFGGIVGMFVAYLTPKTGQAIRDKIQSLKTDESTNIVELANNVVIDTVNSVNEKIKEFTSTSSDIITKAKNLVFSAYLAGKEVYSIEDKSTIEVDTTEKSTEEE
jgi:gas vesicle protein